MLPLEGCRGEIERESRNLREERKRGKRARVRESERILVVLCSHYRMLLAVLVPLRPSSEADSDCYLYGRQRKRINYNGVAPTPAAGYCNSLIPLTAILQLA
ncbi:hypothetical protein LSTR_LSTR015129 [Laodelphax striatellus]|uniref:Uncharacterized protein n=1 Tax=Laodelphax striatellus TaxID=195883 RepID=A0A482X010_LAOST|nr:hypothetical protein LSTR_LSTR005757 [Laodelphax striatellus]RZF48431.1 hypothetical protein LSTR_LSTR015129 [Laodelphax striatellus]